MSSQDEQLPPVPQHTPPIEEAAAGLKRFESTWLRWLLQLRDKVNVINASLANLGALVGTGFTVKGADGVWHTRVIEAGPSGFVTVVDGDGIAGNPTIDVDLPSQTGAVGCTFDGGGSAIVAGTFCDIVLPFGISIVSATLLADQIGSVVIDVWADSYGNYPPNSGDKITGSAPPTISTAIKSQDTTLTDWTLTKAAGTTIRFSVTSCSTITRVTLTLKVLKT